MVVVTLVVHIFLELLTNLFPIVCRDPLLFLVAVVAEVVAVAGVEEVESVGFALVVDTNDFDDSCGDGTAIAIFSPVDTSPLRVRLLTRFPELEDESR